MKILIVAATAFEVKGITQVALIQGIPVSVAISSVHQTDILITGVGAVQVAFHLARFADNYDFVLNIGIAGSFKPSICIGDVVVVTSDCFGDYGIDDNGKFITLSQAGLMSGVNQFANDIIFNPWIDSIEYASKLKHCNGVTVGTASGSLGVIDHLVKTWNPDIETMESAAVFYACISLSKRFLCLRAISNFVEPRNRSAWKVNDALSNLKVHVLNIITELGVARMG